MSPVESSPTPAIASLYSDHHRWLLEWLRRRLGCIHSAADLAQDTFVRILASRDALVAMQEPRAYLTTTAKRLLIDRRRRQLIEQAYLAELAQCAAAMPGYPGPEQILTAIEALQQIGAALAAVAPKARQAFLLHYLDGLSQAEVAIQLGVSTRMVRKYLVQALLCCGEPSP